MRKLRIGWYLLAASIPVILGATVAQTFRHQRVVAELRALEDEQREWVEENQRLIAGIAVLSSAERIEDLAKTHLGLSKVEPEKVLMVRIRGRGRGDG